jgi:competence protein ComEC
MRKSETLTILALIIFAALTVAAWHEVIVGRPPSSAAAHFLDVGQGDAELVVLPGGVKVLTDAGPDSRAVTQSLDRVLQSTDRYIDLAIISHPQLDHFGGFAGLLDRYRIGAFIVNGRSDTPAAAEWQALIGKITEQGIPIVVLRAGDRIRYADSSIEIVSPDAEMAQSGDLNDTGFVERVQAPGLRVLLTADIDSNLEERLVQTRGSSIVADILKVAHHGSKYSTSDAFLRAIDPLLAVIEVGAKNTYGHPAPETLARLANAMAERARLASTATANVFRTDKNGTVSVVADAGKLRVYTER